nr:uncharacterized protein LOC111415269 isoform X1 [Onthophagus taurus]
MEDGTLLLLSLIFVFFIVFITIFLIIVKLGKNGEAINKRCRKWIIRQCRKCRSCFSKSDRPGLRRRPSSNQDDDVWNISSRVNQQNQDGTPPNWPTHDHRLSMDFVITPEYNIKDTRPPPPPYSELDLPSYEQATGCRPPRADLTPVHQQSDQNRPGPSS